MLFNWLEKRVPSAEVSPVRTSKQVCSRRLLLVLAVILA